MEERIEISDNIKCINQVLEIVENTFSDYNNGIIQKEEFKCVMYDSISVLNVLIADISYAADLEPVVLQEKLKNVAEKLSKEYTKESVEEETHCKFINMGNA